MKDRKEERKTEKSEVRKGRNEDNHKTKRERKGNRKSQVWKEKEKVKMRNKITKDERRVENQERLKRKKQSPGSQLLHSGIVIPLLFIAGT